MSGRLCPACDREITAELVELHGTDEAVDIAGEPFPDADDTDYARAEIEATIRLSCRCSYYDIANMTGSVTAFRMVPDEWDYEEVVDP